MKIFLKAHFLCGYIFKRRFDENFVHENIFNHSFLLTADYMQIVYMKIVLAIIFYAVRFLTVDFIQIVCMKIFVTAQFLCDYIFNCRFYANCVHENILNR